MTNKVNKKLSIIFPLGIHNLLHFYQREITDLPLSDSFKKQLTSITSAHI